MDSLLSKTMRKSIKHNLLLWLLIPLLTLAVLSTTATYILGVNLARNIYDKQLLNSADSVAARLRVRGGRISVDLPPAAQSILRHNYHDEFYFQVISPDGVKIAGDQILPSPPAMPGDSEPIFRTVKMKGREVRLVCLSAPTPELAFDHVLIQVAETRNTRMAFAGQVTLYLLLVQLVLIVSGAVAIWIGIRRGLLPLTRVEQTVQARSPGDLTPLNVDEPIEILSLTKAINRLLDALKDDIEAQKRFTSNAAHQLRTPLAIIGTYTDLARKLLQEKRFDEVVDVLAELDSGTKRMSRLVNRLLTLAKSDPTVASSRPGIVLDLNTCASNVCAAHVPDALKKQIELEFQSAYGPALVYGDPAALEELISNLVENSILYTQPNGSVTINLSVSDSKTVLTVSDDGLGIPSQERERVFERFYRVSGTEQHGTGLGLAIVKEIATAHNAVVNIADGPSKRGTTFSIDFPIPKLNGSNGKP
ncbi:MAG: sensor histidine kinase [Cyanobacteria bacterium]|nr:sensor histidine kinase [Cyanobacteriota bacterium]